MTTLIKTPAEIAIMQAGGRQLAAIRDRLEKMAQPGVTLAAIEQAAWKMLADTGGEPAFARVPGYKYATCLNVNDSFVHGIPGPYALRENDLLSIDVGLFYQGFNTDTSVSLRVAGDRAARHDRIDRFLEAGRKTLDAALAVIRPGSRVGQISEIIQRRIEAAGYQVSRQLTGHGIGRELHEAPKIPCFLREPVGTTMALVPNMTLAIEVLYLEGGFETVTDIDGWTIRSEDGKMTAVFEKTIAVTDDGCLILT